MSPFAALPLAGLLLALAAAPATAFTIEGSAGTTVQATEIATFDEPWAMTFLPDGTMLVTTKPGSLFHVTQDGEKRAVEGMWEVAYGGQGGLGDVVLHPEFDANSLVYISSIETPDRGDTYRAVVTRARLERSGDGVRLADAEKIWTQQPKTGGQKHFSHRLAFGPDGKLYISSGDRQEREPAQGFDTALGKIIRLNDDGSVPRDNPWQDRGELAQSFWTMGHRNVLGLAFDAEGRLWANEMGPRGGDELNLIAEGANYGWPVVSDGEHYSGAAIPDHDTTTDYEPPKVSWVPSISPAGLVIYDGALFEDWRGDALMGALSGRALVRVDLDGEEAKEAERFSWDARVREVEQGPDGAVWVLEDRDGARLLRLTPGE